MKKSLVVYICIFVAALVIISFFGGSASYAIFFGITLIPVVSFLYIFIVIRLFKIHQKTDVRTMTVDSETGYYFVLQNNSPISFYGIKIIPFSNFFSLKDKIEEKPYTLLPFEKVSFTTRVSCRYRGEYPIGVQAVEVSDFLNLFKVRYKLPDVPQAIVKPKIVELEKLSNISIDFSSNIIGQKNGSDIIDASVRNYSKGDALNRIHWKASAKTSDLKVKNSLEEKKRGISVFFDGRRNSQDINQYLPYENKVLETVIAVCRYFAGQNEEVDIISNNKMKVLSLADFENFYQSISEYSFNENFNTVDEMYNYVNDIMIEKPKISYFVVGELTDELIGLTDDLINASIKSVVYVISDEIDDRIAEYYSDSRQIIQIGTNADLLTVL